MVGVSEEGFSPNSFNTLVPYSHLDPGVEEERKSTWERR